MALDQEWTIKHDDFTNKNREWTREARDLTAQSDQFMAWKPILSNPQTHRKVGHLEITVEQSIVFEHPRKEICSVVLVHLKKHWQWTTIFQILSPMLASHRCWNMHTNMCPCPKSPSFVGVHIPAPWFANMGVPPGFPLAILKRAYPKNHPVVMDDHDGSYWNNKKVTTWDPPF